MNRHERYLWAQNQQVEKIMSENGGEVPPGSLIEWLGRWQDEDERQHPEDYPETTGD